MTVGIVGVGLIGGSIGLALKGAGHAVIGHEPDAANRAKALERHCLDEAVPLAEVGGADAVFVAVPPSATRTVLTELIPHLGEGTAVSDCASVKSEIAAWASSEARLAPVFIPGHPMAGHEKGGPAFASEWLFRGARWLVTPSRVTTAAARDRIAGLIREMGATPVRIEADAHDRAVAVASHLPHVLASALLELGQSADAEGIGAGSWRDLTRVGGVEPDLWSQILAGNAEHLEWAVDSLIGSLAEWRSLLRDEDALRARLTATGRLKSDEPRTPRPRGRTRR